MRKGKLLVSFATTDKPKCVVCKKDLGEKVVCFTINSVQCVSIPLCADCLEKASQLLRKANKEDE